MVPFRLSGARRSESFSPVPRARARQHPGPARAPSLSRNRARTQCGGPNSSLVAAQVLVKLHVAVTAALDLWSELPKQLRPPNSVLAVRSLPQLGSDVLPAMDLSRVLRI